MGIKVFDVVGGKQRIHSAVLHSSHICNSSDQIRLGRWVDIQSDLMPVQTGKGSAGCPLAAATNMQKSAVLRQLVGHRDSWWAGAPGLGFYRDINSRGGGVAQILVRQLDAVVKEALRRRALRHSRSMEEEVRLILAQAVAAEEEVSLSNVGFGSGMAALFSGAAQFES